MGGGPKTTTTSDNQYGYFQKPGWAQLEKLEAWRPEDDPSIDANFGEQQRNLERSFVSPTGSYQTPELREQQIRSGTQQIGQNRAIAKRADKYGQNQLRLGQLGQAAGLGAPEFAQTKGTQTQKQSGGLLNTLVGGALGMASKFI